MRHYKPRASIPSGNAPACTARRLAVAARALLASIVCAALAALHAAADEFPYRGMVRADGVYVRSGPGTSYYPTGQLREGDIVEVYRHDPGGWLAIRPPPGSFTWVAARYLELIEPDIAVVTADHVLARVGSPLTDARDIWHVKLRAGEEVLVLQRPQQQPSGDGGWYKIAPPAGEFRWVAAQFIQRIGDAVPQAPPRHDTPADTAPLDHVASGIVRPEQAASSSAASDSAPSTNDSSAQAPLDDRPSVVAADASAEPRPAASPAATPQQADAEPHERAYYERCAALDLELSTVVSQELGTWSLHSLRQRAALLQSDARTSGQRAMAQHLLDKIDHFDQLQQRIVALDHAMAQSDRRPASRPEQPPPQPPAPPASDPFDASGELVPVRSTRFGAPQYVVLDETGAVQCYVTAAPGVHLRPYQGRRVGIIGTRDFLPELRAAHVTARQVRVLDGNTLR
jgi:uncharacterized protein YraI